MTNLYAWQSSDTRLVLAVAPDAEIAQLTIWRQLRTAGSDAPLSMIKPERFVVRPAETLVAKPKKARARAAA